MTHWDVWHDSRTDLNRHAIREGEEEFVGIITNVVSYYHAVVWGICHAARTNDSCCMYECVVSHVCSSHITHERLYERRVVLPCFGMGNESCRTYHKVVSHVCSSHVSHMRRRKRRIEYHAFVWGVSRVAYLNESCHEWVMSHVCSGHVAHGRHHERGITLQCFCTGNESRRTYEWVTSHSCMGCALHVRRCDRRISQPFFCLGSESYTRVISHRWISRAAYMWMNHTIRWISHVAHHERRILLPYWCFGNVSHRTYQWVMLHI